MNKKLIVATLAGIIAIQPAHGMSHVSVTQKKDTDIVVVAGVAGACSAFAYVAYKSYINRSLKRDYTYLANCLRDSGSIRSYYSDYNVKYAPEMLLDETLDT